MATKKQKREANYRKHLEFMAEVRRTGLEAQRKDKEHRQVKEQNGIEKPPAKKRRTNNTIKESK